MRYVALLSAASAILLVAAGCSASSDVVPKTYQNPKAAKDTAATEVCKTNLRAIYSAEQALKAQAGRVPTAEELGQSMGGLPKEPAGGAYGVDPRTGAISCSVGHGKYPE